MDRLLYFCLFASALSLLSCTQSAEKEKKWYCGVPDSPPTHRDSMPGIMKAKCATCHTYDLNGTGPKLAGATERMPAGKWFAAFLRAEDSLAERKDPYVLQLKATSQIRFDHTFADLTPNDIETILKYMRYSQ